MKAVFLIILSLSSLATFAQEDSTKLNQDAIYNRPFINVGETRTAVGGYIEGNTNYFVEDGITEGFSMELRRFNIFLFSQIGKRIKLLSELEFEHGTEEIAIETAILDFSIAQGITFRAGILLPAIGVFNTNHDSPNWGFVERPISSTGIIPTTLSEVGFGFQGKLYPTDQVILSYDAYLVNGLRDNIILNNSGRTDISQGKSPEMFGEDNNGSPMLNGRISIANRKIGELGLSTYGGTYNSYRLEGEAVDVNRKMWLFAADFSTSINNLQIIGEVVKARIDVPTAINEIYGTEQIGGFVDFTHPIYKGKVGWFENSEIQLALRAEYADFNQGNFTSNITTRKGDENMGYGVGLSFLPQPGTRIRANYRYNQVTDVLANPAAKIAGFQFGVASYF
jgi:hypothetical protein